MSCIPELVDDLMLDSDEECSVLETEEEEIIVSKNIDEEEIFQKPKKKTAKAVKATVVEATAPVVDPIKPKTRPKKVLSEEQKRKMQEGRKKKHQEKTEIVKLRKAADDKLRKKEKEELENIINEVPPEKPKAEIDPVVIQKAIDEAIIKHETLRKSRKAAKKAAIEEEVQKRKVEEEIKAALYPPKLYHTDSGFYSKHIFQTK
jgi:type IV secretory pathway VirB10-like protein